MCAKKYSKEEKEKYVEKFKNSNKSQTAFARINGIPEATFRGWLNYQICNEDENDICFEKLELNTNSDIMFSFKYENISIELQNGFDKNVFKKIVEVIIND